MKTTDRLFTLSPLDGRYYDQVSELSSYFSEFALNKQRVFIELRYLQALSKYRIVRRFSPAELSLLEAINQKFDAKEAVWLKKYEVQTKHDLKAIEYYLQNKLKDSPLKDVIRYIHFGLTSEDVNNLAYSTLLQSFHTLSLMPTLHHLLLKLKELAQDYKSTPLLAKTHGQPAVPTTFGKEICVFYSRLYQIQKLFKRHQFEGKLNGAVGNYNALALLYPHIDWIQFSQQFISSFQLTPCLITTQILPSDSYVLYFSYLHLINSILISLCQDIWTYISNTILTIKKEPGQVGSSTMPQKINPIDFENAEGNLQIANSIFELLISKLPISRLQRDLTDSTVKRSFGTAFGHTILAWKNIVKGLNKISLNETYVTNELSQHYEVLGELLQLYLRDRGDDKGYEKIKKELQGKSITHNDLQRLMKKYKINLNYFNPSTYIGIAERLVESCAKNIL